MWHNDDDDGVVDVLIDNHNQANDAADDKLPLKLPGPSHSARLLSPHSSFACRSPSRSDCGSGSGPTPRPLRVAAFNDDVALDRWVDGLIALK